MRACMYESLVLMMPTKPVPLGYILCSVDEHIKTSGSLPDPLLSLMYYRNSLIARG